MVSLASALIIVRLLLIWFAWVCSARSSRALAIKLQHNATDASALIVSTPIKIVVKGPFFIFSPRTLPISCPPCPMRFLGVLAPGRILTPPMWCDARNDRTAAVLGSQRPGNRKDARMYPRPPTHSDALRRLVVRWVGGGD